MVKSKLNIPVFVTGIERSGSSLIARIIEMCGGFTGETTTMCENKKIKQFVNTYYENSLSIDNRGQYPLPDYSQMPIPFDWKNKVEDILIEEGYSEKVIWMYKSARIAQIWPIWAFAYPNAKYIIVRRRTGDVISSCLKTGFMDAYEDPSILEAINVLDERSGWLWWVHEHEKLFVSMMEKGLDCKVIWPERMLNGNFQQIHEMLRWLDLPWKTGIISLLESTLIKTK